MNWDLMYFTDGLMEGRCVFSPLIGRPGGLGLGDVLCPSVPAPSNTGRPKMASSSLVSGGGMG